jgi:hypothetical protein
MSTRVVKSVEGSVENIIEDWRYETGKEKKEEKKKRKQGHPPK